LDQSGVGLDGPEDFTGLAVAVVGDELLISFSLSWYGVWNSPSEGTRGGRSRR
jgi:hypothetical protein